jgi:hypothetical protein
VLVAAPAQVTVAGEVRTVDPNGEARLWGRGRPGTGVYPKAITPGTHYCVNPDTGVKFGLSTAWVDWGAAAEACPSGTWVCRLQDLVACNTARPDTDADEQKCDGSYENWAADNHYGWVADVSASPSTPGWSHAFSESGSTLTTGAGCRGYPVWCCWN